MCENINRQKTNIHKENNLTWITNSLSVCPQDAVSCGRVAALPVEVAARCVFGLSAHWPGQTEADGSDGSVYWTAGRLLGWRPASMISFTLFKPAETDWDHRGTHRSNIQTLWTFIPISGSDSAASLPSWARLNCSFNMDLLSVSLSSSSSTAAVAALRCSVA